MSVVGWEDELAQSKSRKAWCTLDEVLVHTRVLRRHDLTGSIRTTIPQVFDTRPKEGK